MTLPQLDFTDFGFKANPFSITPDPRYLFLSSRHEESLAHLLYGAGPNGGFVQLTGEVGTGKTLLIRALLEQSVADVTMAYIFNPRLSQREFLAAVCDEFSVPYDSPPTSSKQLLDKLIRFLLKIYSQGKRAVLIIDEAQNLNPRVLETIRLLTNLETSSHKLLRIILVGQPELEHLLSRKELRQVAQRITARCTLTPLQGCETLAYIKHRLMVAGLPEGLFKRSALWLVHLLSGGVPRIINTLCERALLGLYAQGSIRVGAWLIIKASREIASPDHFFKTKLRQFASTVIVLFGGIGLVLASMPDTTLLEGERLSAQQRTAVISMVSDTVSRGRRNSTKKPAELSIKPVRELSAAPYGLLSGDKVHRIKRSVSNHDLAIEKLFALWGVNIRGRSISTACEYAVTKGLRCMVGMSDLNQISQMNRPALLKMTLGKVPSYLLVHEIVGDNLRVDDGTGISTLSKAFVERYWQGRFLLIWRPRTSVALIGPGSNGEPVRWVHQQLALWQGGTVSTLSKTFDKKLEQQVKRFQVAHNLQTDGIAGEKTMLLLINQAEINDVPRLRGAAMLTEG